ncbi:hypothetical protein V2J09_010714 [Rumex salicifolius]
MQETMGEKPDTMEEKPDTTEETTCDEVEGDEGNGRHGSNGRGHWATFLVIKWIYEQKIWCPNPTLSPNLSSCTIGRVASGNRRGRLLSSLSDRT